MTDRGSLSDAAYLARETLFHHPHLNTPQAISSGPLSIEQIDVQDFANGLTELAALQPPQAFKTASGTWKLTPAGVAEAG